MNTRPMKYIVLFLMWIVFCTNTYAQKITYVKMYGDTYTIHMIKGWYKCTGEIQAKGPARKKWQDMKQLGLPESVQTTMVQ